jgi:zinc protease
MKKLASILLAVAACGGTATSTTTPAAPAAPTAPAAPVATEPTTADQVMEASIAAQGGRGALAKLTSVKTTGALEISGIKGTVVILTAPPRESLMTVDLPGLGKLVSGVHNDLAWEKNPIQGARVLTGPELANALRDATFNGDLVWKQLFPKAELQGVVDFAGTKAYKLLLTDGSGETETRYIAKDTKLPLGVEMIAPTQMGKLPVLVTNADFRDVNGLKYPFHIENKTAGQSFTVTVSNIELSAPIDPKTFEVPDDVKALAAHP